MVGSKIFAHVVARHTVLFVKGCCAVVHTIAAEITETAQLPLFADVDLIQVGARNMQNFELLKSLGKLGKPVIPYSFAIFPISFIVLSL